MLHKFSRTEILLGKESMEKLKNAKVVVVGIGGVGSYTVEALVRCGVGNLVMIDDDLICLTNINRQLHANSKTVGKSKVEAMKARILEINPNIEIEIFQEFVTPHNVENLIFPNYSYVVDAIDTVTAKISLIEICNKLNVPIISSMGAGNKLYPELFQISDIYETSICPLAKVMRKELKKRGITSLKVCYSKEVPIIPIDDGENSCSKNCVCPSESKRNCSQRRQVPGSISFVPSAVGLIIAGQVTRDLIQKKET